MPMEGNAEANADRMTNEARLTKLPGRLRRSALTRQAV